MKRQNAKKLTSYQKRERWLRNLGFRSYKEYLESPQWKSIRRRILARAKGRCEVCGQPATQVHHRSYDVGSLSGTTWSLVAICRECHEYGEFDDKGQKLLSTTKVNRRLASRAASFGLKLISSCRANGCNNHRAYGKELCGSCEKVLGPETRRHRGEFAARAETHLKSIFREEF